MSLDAALASLGARREGMISSASLEIRLPGVDPKGCILLFVHGEDEVVEFSSVSDDGRACWTAVCSRLGPWTGLVDHGLILERPRTSVFRSDGDRASKRLATVAVRGLRGGVHLEAHSLAPLCAPEREP